MRYGIRAKIMTLPAIVLLGTVIIVSIYIAALNRQKAKIDRFEANDFNRSIQVSNLFAGLSSAHSDLEISLASYSRDGDREKILHKLTASKTVIADIMRDLERVKSAAQPTQVELRILGVMASKLDNYRQQIGKISRAVAAGDTTDPLYDSVAMGREYTQISMGLNLVVQRMHGRTNETITSLIEGEKKLWRLQLGIFAGMIALIVVAGIVLAGFIAKPIIRLTRLTSSIVNTQNFRLRADVHSNDEVGELAVSFNTMLHTIETSQNELREALERERRFTENAAHELRTPLAALKIQAEVTMRMQDAKQRQDMLQKLVANVDRTTHMVTQLLEFARLENDNMAMERCELDEITEDIVDELSNMANSKHIDIYLEIEEHSKYDISGNHRALEILLHNLLGNAIKYTAEGGEIHVSLAVSESQVILTIKDTGIGIPQSELDNIYERFYRASDERARQEDGAGLGLAISKFVADAHNARMHIENRKDRQGTQVVVTYPRIHARD